MSEYRLFQFSIEKFLADASSDAVVPGGGSVSIVSAAAGVALLQMAINVTLRDQKERSEGVLQNALFCLTTVGSALRGAAEADIDVFGAYMKAIKLPKIEPREIELRDHSLNDLSNKMVCFPLSTVDRLLECLHVAEQAQPLVKKSVVSDLYCGSEIIYGSALALLLNVDINLKSNRVSHLKNDALKMRTDKTRLLNEAIAKLRILGKRDGFHSE